ncbi:MAG TPA: beta-ketoacyl synthase N-terminal-like domain-containing protein [Candidatus Polarisedimenticolia bacterium]|nr:beta-ketoacyl synthase N-terminal-like domain-containing protein [Candidatus Polarisedimenticolia bacterium]
MTPGRRDIAIIGMACVFPKAPDLRTYWENILGSVDAIGDPPAGSGTERVFDPSSNDNDRLYTKRGGYLGDIVRFDPLEYGVMPRAVDGSEPEHFLALRLAHDALKDSGYLERPFNRKAAGLILGRGTYVNRGVISCFQHTIVVDEVLSLLRTLHPEHGPEDLEAIRRSLKAGLPPFNPETAPGLAHSVMVGRVANRLDLMGPAFTVDAACASSLIAVDAGIKSLATGECDLVLAGGIQASTTFPIALLFSQLGALARSGRIRPFHPDADGTLLGEGAGIVVLKRHADAVRDGDRIYAIIRGLGTSSDGKAMGILAPRLEGEELAMRRAYESSGIDPRSIGLVEAHGTGTPVGDATEIEALRRVFGDGDGQPRLPVGSVKSMIGHCIPAAAAAGLIKTALALHHRILPPTLGGDAPHPKLLGSGFYLNTQTRPWIHGGHEPRRAGVSAFGFGGINAHAILEEAPAPARAIARSAAVFLSGAQAGVAPAEAPAPRLLHARRDSELYVVAAPSRDELRARVSALGRFAKVNPSVAPHDLALTVNCPASAAPGGAHRLAIVAASLEDLEKKAAYAAERLGDPACGRIKERSGIYHFGEPLAEAGGLAFLFPGEGAQYAGMLADLCLHFPEVREWFDLMDRAFRDHDRGFVPSEVLFPPPAVGRIEAAQRLWEMDSAIESVFAANQGLLALLDLLGARPGAVVGHSTGEYSALLAAGAARVPDEARLIDYILDGNRATERARKSGKVPSAALLAVGPADPELLRVLTGSASGLDLAMDNCPHQIVVCGSDEAIARAQADLRARGAVCQRLPFSRAYHTARFAPVVEELREYYDRGDFAAPEIPLYSCATAGPAGTDPVEIRRVALEQWMKPVRFRETIEAMYAAGTRIFVEVGPRGNLTAFVEDTLRGRPHLAVASNLKSRSGMLQLHHLLALLAAHGVPLTLEPLYADRGARRLPEEPVREGTRLPAKPDRSMALAFDLPQLRLDDALVRGVAARAEAARREVATRAAAAGSAAAQPAEPTGGTQAVIARATPSPKGMSAAMSEYLRTMDRFLATQSEVMQAVLARGGNGRAGRVAPAAPPIAAPEAAPAAARRTLAFLADPPRREPDGSLVFRKALDPDEERFLLDHTLGGRIAEDASLRALPVFPLAMSLEMMAEAAVLALPGLRVIGARSVRVHRWLAFPGGRVSLEVTAAPNASTREVTVRIAETAAAAGGAPLPTVEGTILLGERFPDAPPAGPADLGEPRAFRWAPEELYAEGRLHGMFHGPSFQGVVSIDRAFDAGAEGTLRVLPARGLFRSRTDAELVLDPLLLDAASQVVGFWTANRLDRGFVVFPVGFERLDLFAPAPPPGTEAACRIRARLAAGEQILADLEVVAPDGRALLRLSGWDVKRMDLPERFYAYRLSPRDVILSTPLPAPLPVRDSVVCCRLDLPDRLMEGDGRIWREGLAHTVLSHGERQAWRGLQGSEGRRTEWLLARSAAKDAVRLFLKERRGLSVYAADVEIGADALGRPIASGAWVERAGGAPVLSMSSGGGVAVAVAGEGRRDRGLGIVAERVSPAGARPEDGSFSPEEDRLLGALEIAERPEWTLRMRCAKEAGAHALGRGIPSARGALRALSIDAGRGTVRMGVDGLDAADVTAWTGRDGDLIVATALCEGGQ